MKTLSTLLVISLFSLTLFAQDSDWSKDVYNVGELYPGHIIKLNGEKVEGHIQAQQRCGLTGVTHSNQTRVIFYTDPNNKKSKTVYKPEELKGYLIADKEYKAMNYSGGLMKKPVRFVLKKVDGAIAQYEWWSYDEMKPGDEGYRVGAKKYNSTLLFQKGDEMPKPYNSYAMGFSKKFPELISDHKELAAKVAKKEKGYKMLNMFDVIEEYNAWKANQ